MTGYDVIKNGKVSLQMFVRFLKYFKEEDYPMVANLIDRFIRYKMDIERCTHKQRVYRWSLQGNTIVADPESMVDNNVSVVYTFFDYISGTTWWSFYRENKELFGFTIVKYKDPTIDYANII